MVKTKKVHAPGELVFDVVNVLLLTVFAIMCLYPVVYVFSCSISRGALVDTGSVTLLPKDINMESYKQVLQDKQFWISYANTLFYTLVGSLYSMLISTPAAYVLSRRNFAARKYINMLVAFTMWFTPGFIPLYLNYKSLGAINNRWMIVISFGVVAFNIILLRNYFESVPVDLEESAKIDGANDFTIFLRIYLPLSKPALATVWLYYAMSRWNGYFWSMVLLKDYSKIPLQVYLKQKIIDKTLSLEVAGSMVGQAYSVTTTIYALVICSMIPVLIVFPFIQKYFTKGVTVGAVKG